VAILRNRERGIAQSLSNWIKTSPFFKLLVFVVYVCVCVAARRDPFIWCYLYGLMIHKLGHFHDIVHGTRHDYYMHELRIEFLEPWLELLEAKGFDPAAIETGELRFTVKQIAPGQTVN